MNRFFVISRLVFYIVGVSISLQAERIKDLTLLEGMRKNQLIGYGIVVGIDGKGDSDLEVTKQSIAASLKNFQINTETKDIKTKNAAAVMITANIDAYQKPGTAIDVTVASMGDAKSLQGGVLLQTPLLGADGVVYAVAQGPLAIGGFLAGSDGKGGSTVQKNHPTVGMIPGGASIEREIKADWMHKNSFNLVLRNPDVTTAVRIADAVNRIFAASAKAESPQCVNVNIPQAFMKQEINFLAALESIEVQPDTKARIVINERTGTIVATKDVRISTSAISQGSLTVKIQENLSVSQPSPLSNLQGNSYRMGDGAQGAQTHSFPVQNQLVSKDGIEIATGGATVVTPSTDTQVQEDKSSFWVLKNYLSVDRLVAAFNALGVTTRDMIAVFQSLKAAGTLQAELIIQ